MENRSERHKKQWFNKKVVTGIVSLTIAIIAMTSIAYADADIQGILQSWFNKKTETVINNLDQSLRSETEKQKAILKNELQLRLQASSNHLDEYAKEQERMQIEIIEQYAAALIAGMDIANEQDIQKIRDELQAIVNSTKEAMDSVSGSYVPSIPEIPLSEESDKKDEEMADVEEGEGETYLPTDESNAPVVETVDDEQGEDETLIPTKESNAPVVEAVDDEQGEDQTIIPTDESNTPVVETVDDEQGEDETIIPTDESNTPVVKSVVVEEGEL